MDFFTWAVHINGVQIPNVSSSSHRLREKSICQSVYNVQCNQLGTQLNQILPVVAKPGVVGEANELDKVAVPQRRVLVCDLFPVRRIDDLTNLLMKFNAYYAFSFHVVEVCYIIQA